MDEILIQSALQARGPAVGTEVKRKLAKLEDEGKNSGWSYGLGGGAGGRREVTKEKKDHESYHTNQRSKEWTLLETMRKEDTEFRATLQQSQCMEASMNMSTR